MFSRIAGCAAFLVPALLLQNVALAQNRETVWPSALICRASVHSYFNLTQPPRQMEESFGWLTFRGALGGIYDCQVRGNVVSLKWKSHNGTMSSSNTQADADGPVLTVRPGGKSEWRFRRAADGYGVLS